MLPINTRHRWYALATIISTSAFAGDSVEWWISGFTSIRDAATDKAAAGVTCPVGEGASNSFTADDSALPFATIIPNSDQEVTATRRTGEPPLSNLP